MTLDAAVVTLVVGGAVAYLVWTFLPRKRAKPPACAACVHDPAPVRPPSRTNQTV